jgi:hypothetical protein
MVGIDPPHRRRPEDTAQGCRDMAEADRSRAADTSSAHMRETLERSAQAWGNRAALLNRLEASSGIRAEAAAREREKLRSEREHHGQGTGSTEQGEAQAEGQDRQVEKRARPRIKGLSLVPERKDEDAD